MTTKSQKSAKPPLLFIHGFRGAPSGLEAIAKEFPDYDVHIPNIPPSGIEALDAYDVKHYTAFISRYIRENDLKNPVLVGHSMGSIIAAAVANRFPKLINNKIIFLAPITKKIIRPIAWLSPLIFVMPNRLASSIINRFLFVPKYNEYLYKATLEEAADGAKQYTSRVDLAKSAHFSSSHNVNIFKLHKKPLIISGEKDRIVPCKATQKYAKNVDAELYFIPGAGHLLNYEEPKVVARLMRRFLEK